MSNFLGICEACKKRALYVAKRTYPVNKFNQLLKSQSKLCGKCFKGIKKALQTI